MSLAKGLKLMADMGAGIVAKMSSPSMPSDSSIKNTLKEVAKQIDDYTKEAANAVNEMADKLLAAVKKPINDAIKKDPPEIPKPSDIASSIYQAIQDAAPTV